MNFKDIKNIRWADPTNKTIHCGVNFDNGDDLYEYVFVVSPDSESAKLHEENDKIFTACVSGSYGVVTEFVAPPPIIGERALGFFEILVNDRLEEVKSVLNDPVAYSSLTLAKKDEWNTYQNALQQMLVDIKEPVFEFSMETKWFVLANGTFPTKP